MKNKTGFTLVELMISMSIIAILSVVLSISFSKAQKSGRDQRRIDDLKAVQSAAEQYYLLNNAKYPTSTGVAWTGPGSQVILQKFPIDPKSIVGSTIPYSVVGLGVGSTGYCICADVENDKNGNSDGNTCVFGDAAENNCKLLNTCYFCIKNQQ
jgi:prepilin-type N-terminal cleavage/methylation domain-containing protein